PRQSLLDVDVSLLLPVIPGGIPDGEAPIRLCVDNQSRIPGAASLPEPTLVARDILALVGHPLGLRRHAKSDARWLLDVGRPSRVTGGQLRIEVLRPSPGECPPCYVEQEAFAESVVACDEVQARRELHLHLGGWPNILQVQVLKHRSSPFAFAA